ncbi:CBS domain-containing protein [Streptomyces sp. NPDC017529]|uniref:CBS domain-containing protein n=1 Tax=Streptomyces sp. NPDC017529 TaxID=3365000 RepID=UPI0037A55C05
MTVVQIQPRPATPGPAGTTAIDAMETAGPRIWDDMTVEVALSVMAGARAERLLVCDNDSRCIGVVTQAQLIAVRDGSQYTDQVRLREVLGGSGPVGSHPAVENGCVPGARAR